MGEHRYSAAVEWAGSTAGGYRSYERAHRVDLGEAGTLRVSADPAFRGDAALPNPEQLLLAAASSCQLMSFLAEAAFAGVEVLGYTDSAEAVMPVRAEPLGITEIALHVRVTVRGSDAEAIRGLMQTAHEKCFIANSLSAAIRIETEVEIV